MNLAIFDIDGTLLQTQSVDEACFAQALEEIIGIAQDWDDCSHMTDSCIFGELFAIEHKRLPEDPEIQAFIDRFVTLLGDAYQDNAHSIIETPGAQALLKTLGENSEWCVAIATGGWRKSAEFKFQCANLSMGDIPFSTANDGVSREEIVKDAISKAKIHYGIEAFSKMVSIGDAEWDLRTAKNLNIPLIGVGERLVDSGVPIVRDFEDTEVFLQLLEQE